MMTATTQAESVTKLALYTVENHAADDGLAEWLGSLRIMWLAVAALVDAPQGGSDE